VAGRCHRHPHTSDASAERCWAKKQSIQEKRWLALFRANHMRPRDDRMASLTRTRWTVRGWLPVLQFFKLPR
jgi:hypothetical protein